jgi:hypothetical protein
MAIAGTVLFLRLRDPVRPGTPSRHERRLFGSGTTVPHTKRPGIPGTTAGDSLSAASIAHPPPPAPSESADRRKANPKTSIIATTAVAELSSGQWLAQAHRFSQSPEATSPRDWADLAKHIPPGQPRQEFLDLFRSVLPRYSIDAMLDALPDVKDVDLLNATQEALAGKTDTTVLAALIARCTAPVPDGDRTALLGVVQHLRNAALAESLATVAETARQRGDRGLARAAWDSLSLMGSLQACGFLFQEMKLNNHNDSSPPDPNIGEAISRMINPDALPLLQAMARGLDLGAPAESRIAAIRALGNYDLTQVEGTLTAITDSEIDATILEAVWATKKRLAPPVSSEPDQD